MAEPIVFGGGGVPKEPIQFESAQGKADRLAEEKEKHRKRVERFGGDVKEPKLQNILTPMEIKRHHVGREGFSVGFDMYNDDEQRKREERARKFGLEPPKPKEDDLKEMAKRKRAERFGVEYKAPEEESMDVDLLEQRTEVQPTAAPREEALHVYGVDVMSTKEIYAYFSDYFPNFVEWINDSSCNVVFNDKFSAKRALKKMGEPIEEGQAVPGEEGAVAEGAAGDLSWHKGPPFEKAGVKIPLSFRIATVEDVKPAPGTAKHVTRRLWVRGKNWKGTVGPGASERAEKRRQKNEAREQKKREWEEQRKALEDTDLRSVLGGEGGGGMRSDAIDEGAGGGAAGGDGDAAAAEDDERPAVRMRRGSDGEDGEDVGPAELPDTKDVPPPEVVDMD